VRTHQCRGLNVEGEAEAWDFGVAAGFYVNATVDKWKNWRMYDYVTKVCDQPGGCGAEEMAAGHCIHSKAGLSML
jgi:S-formylglutathione hydrolase FrmB